MNAANSNMRKIFLLLSSALFAILGQSAQSAEIKTGHFINGNSFYDDCGSPSKGTYPTYCIGYVSGVVDDAENYAISGIENKAYCLRKGIIPIQILDIFRNYLEAHPELRDKDAAVLLIIALNQKFPCPK